MAAAWQRPYLNIFKHFRVQDWKRSAREGDVVALTDPRLKGPVYRLRGPVPGSSSLQLPRPGTRSLRLHGRFLYLLFRPVSCKHFLVHLDVVTENPNVWAQKGHLCYLREEFPEAKLCYEQTLSFLEDAVDMHWVCLRLGSIYLQEKQYGRAKQTYLLACKDSASCLTWLGVGISCYRLHELAEAEDALTEANALNNTNAEVWGYLALVCLQAGREREAEQCYKYTVKLGLKDEALLREIRAVQQRLGFGNPAL